MRRALDLDGPLVIMTYAWDRLMIDPLPGPPKRRRLRRASPARTRARRGLPSSRAKPPACSSLPRLAGELPARLLLLDLTEGAFGVSGQIGAAAAAFGADELVLVDVGGDSLARVGDPGLRSPLADHLAIAACLRTGMPARLVVAGAALDGELEPTLLVTRMTELDATRLPDLAADDFQDIRRVFAWHPSEASGMLAAATDGYRGLVEVRDAGGRVDLTDDTPAVHAIEFAELGSTALTAALVDTMSLDDAEAAVAEIAGISELRYERHKAARRESRPVRHVNSADLSAVDRHARGAAGRGAEYVTLRRLAELLGVTTLGGYLALGRLLAEHRPDQYHSSIYRTG
ncbi:MAG: DUF1152 domain-containing protein [Nocardioides sp.]